MDLMIRQFSNSLIATINESPLPIEVKRLVLKDILAQTSAEADKVIVEQINKAKENKEDGNTAH